MLSRGHRGVAPRRLGVEVAADPNYLYRVLPGLEQDGLIAKQGRGWHPKADA